MRKEHDAILCWLLIGSLDFVLSRRGVPQLDGPHKHLHQRGPHMHQAQGSAGRTRDDSHPEQCHPRAVGQGGVT